MSKIAIYGVGGFGRELIAPLQAFTELEASAGHDERQIVFVDDAVSEGEVCGIPIVSFSDLTSDDYYVIAVGSGEIRQRIEAKCEQVGLKPFSLFAPSFECGPDVTIGDGAVFCHNTMVTASAKIGRQFQANIYSYVAHDCVIGDYVTFGPRVSCNGNVHIDDLAYIGTGAVIKQGTSDKPLRIGKGAIVGMGAVVTKDVAPGAVVVGNPAKPRE
jgi:sugar O-acyltransferase (sialic acid O-acetyltransferase NeuD family)